eukprot:2647704-Lingulodinium_polyedra.AAC.1
MTRLKRCFVSAAAREPHAGHSARARAPKLVCARSARACGLRAVARTKPRFHRAIVHQFMNGAKIRG